MTKGSCETAGNDVFDISNFPPRKAFLSASLKGNDLGKVKLNIYNLVYAFQILQAKKDGHGVKLPLFMQGENGRIILGWYREVQNLGNIT